MSAPDQRPNNPQIEQAGASDQNIQEVHAILLREKPEPAEGYSPMPLFLLGFISAMIFIVSVYFVHNRGGLGPNFSFKEAALVYDERYLPTAGGAAVPKAAVDPVVAGQRLFATCATCHQPTGQGLPGVYPPLAGSEQVLGSDERLVRILLHGLSGPIQVKGNTYNGVMPAFGPGSGYNWNDERISHVLTYIRQAWGNDAPPITAERVTEIRTAVGARAKPWSEAELEALP
jgi:mono/diheme cytochrome c family protein